MRGKIWAHPAGSSAGRALCLECIYAALPRELRLVECSAWSVRCLAQGAQEIVVSLQLCV